MDNLRSVLERVQQNKLQFYLEHNDFLGDDLFVQEEARTLLHEDELTDEECSRCFTLDSVWSARVEHFLDSGRKVVSIVYAPTYQEVFIKFVELLDSEGL